ncbi:M15 family metallopeptidase [Mucilaginibacter sp. BJC16-A38]|uniref:M15 family metallopeptidase n=1 Tax=Mucilaginibacter phenanthrenivorans TaxID=1234842 RepID=UPI0021587F84|nr:M15 family metallopeptidase [Mucilaginibacter phenanthrenivorans]MCR8559261.1 M15 family metallopeptidase [Mucilaginibacter phenanthrenivorans]
MIKSYSKLIFVIPLLCGLKAAKAQDYSSILHVENQAQYLEEVKADPNKKLVEIKKYIPEITLDIRYATANNFMHRKMYQQARAFARLPVVMALKDVEADLKTRGLGLKIYDAYRPYSVTVKFYKETPDTNFVADPKKGSKHNRGCAIDLGLIDLKTGKDTDMPTGFDSFSRKAGANYAELPKQEIDNRELLKSVMAAHGFKVISTEWWHYDYNGWPNYPLLDIPFAAI